MPIYTRAKIKEEVTALATGSFTTTDFDIIVNRAVRQVLSDVDLRSAKRKSALSPNLFDEIYHYVCPSDMKGNKIIDIQPQINRSKSDSWELVTAEEFDRRKKEGGEDNLVAFSDNDMVRKLLVSRSINDNESSIATFDAVGDWTAFGDGTNLTKDSDNYVKGNASLNWDINDDGGTTAGVYNDSLSVFDITSYMTTGSVFVWVYISSTDDITNFILRIGSNSSNYYYMTETTNNEGTAFTSGWNLLRFDFVDKVETGTVDADACTYIALYMTKDATKVSETDYRFDNLILKKGDHYYVVYYSKYGWVSADGTYLENATDDTDLLVVDTDEYDLIITKTLELMEKHLKNFNEAKNHKTDYDEKIKQYEFKNPSEALVLTQTYHDLQL